MLTVIADNRASYYADKEVPNVDNNFEVFMNFEKVYDKEFHYRMESEDEVFDWASNNMNWEDVSENAQLIGFICGNKENNSYQEGWINREKEIVSKY